MATASSPFQRVPEPPTHSALARRLRRQPKAAFPRLELSAREWYVQAALRGDELFLEWTGEPTELVWLGLGADCHVARLPEGELRVVHCPTGLFATAATALALGWCWLRNGDFPQRRETFFRQGGRYYPVSRGTEGRRVSVTLAEGVWHSVSDEGQVLFHRGRRAHGLPGPLAEKEGWITSLLEVVPGAPAPPAAPERTRRRRGAGASAPASAR